MKKIILVVLSFFSFCLTSFADTNETIKYYKTIYSENGLNYNTYEISKDEYENSNDTSLYGSSVITEYKKLYITNLGNGVKLDLEWKNMPKYKSFDVIALRGEGVSFATNTLVGMQYYKTNGTNSTIRYNSSSGNTKIFQNGVGISMNLVDDSEFYHLSIQINYYKTQNNAKIYGLYQHSQNNVTLAQSQKYTLDSNGYGSVINFDSSVKNYYDKMSGVSVNV